MAEREVTFTVSGTTAEIIINRPEKMNAISPDMLDLLEQYTRTAASHPDIRAVVIQSAGTRAFSAGADIKAWAALDPLDMWRTWTRRGHEVFGMLERLPMPVVVLVDGIAYGGGLELALAGDFMLATENSRFAFPEVGIAAVPGWGGSFRLSERISPGRAKQMVYTGEPVDAKTACRWGLVNEVLPDAEALQSRSRDLIRRICAHAPVSVSCAKQMLSMHDRSRDQWGAVESLAGGLSAMTKDGKEGLQAFFEKRPPSYQGR